jgi:hypothetical protein
MDSAAIAMGMSSASGIGVVVLGFLHVKNAKAIAKPATQFLVDALTAAPGGLAGELAAAPRLLSDAAAIADAALQPGATASATVTVTKP